MENLLVPIWPDAGTVLGGVGRTMIFQLIKDGELETVCIGRRRFVTADSLRDFVERRAQPSGHSGDSPRPAAGSGLALGKSAL